MDIRSAKTGDVPKQSSKFKSIVKAAAITIAALLILLYIGLPAGIGAAALFPGTQAVGAAPAGFETITLTAEDGVLLKGWYAQPANGMVIVLLHGAGGSRENMRLYAEMLVRNDFGVLALDLRGHGHSQGKTNRFGWQGTLDVGAAVGFLKRRPEVRRIGGLGSSMGGEILLGAASAYPEISAIAADGATRRCTEEYLALPVNRPLARSFTARVMYATVSMLSGEKPPKPLLDSMVDASTTRFLLIAAGQNALEIAFNQLFAKTLGSRATLWMVAGADHTGAFGLNPAAYEQHLIDFFIMR